MAAAKSVCVLVWIKCSDIDVTFYDILHWFYSWGIEFFHSWSKHLRQCFLIELKLGLKLIFFLNYKTVGNHWSMDQIYRIKHKKKKPLDCSLRSILWFLMYKVLSCVWKRPKSCIRQVFYSRMRNTESRLYLLSPCSGTTWLSSCHRCTEVHHQERRGSSYRREETSCKQINDKSWLFSTGGGCVHVRQQPFHFQPPGGVAQLFPLGFLS